MDITPIYTAVRQAVVGRDEEVQLILAALGAGRDLLLEGPPGTSKSTILRAIAAASQTTLHFVEGNADLTPAKLVGHHSPARVLQDDYSPDNFVAGPLPQALHNGGLLYIEEFNRVPEDTLNTLITAMAERELTIPRVGTVRAAPGFRVIAAMNPFDNIGTGRLSGAIVDRLCRVRLDYQSEAEERAIVAQRTGSRDGWLIRLAVRAARLTREHPDLRQGASVRAAIDFVLVAEQLARLRDTVLAHAAQDDLARRTLIAAGQTALSIKVSAREAARRHPDAIIAEIVLAALEDLGRGGSPTDPKAGDEVQVTSDGGRRSAFSSLVTRHPTPDTRYPGGETSSGRVYQGDEAGRASANRPRGHQMFRTFAQQHPRLGETLRQRVDSLAALDEALQADPNDRLDILGRLIDLYDRADLRALARRLAAEMIVQMARRDVGGRSGRGKLTSVPFRDCSDLDLERTLDTVWVKPHPTDEDFYGLEWRHRRRAYTLMLDMSGSMKGAAIFRAALALSAVAVRVHPDPFAVVAFWRDAAILKRLDEVAPLDTLLDRLLSLSGRGMTDIGQGLRVGLDELARADTQQRVGLLFSDGLQTVGLPPEPVAAAFPTLHVVGTGHSDESIVNCARLAALGNGHFALISDITEIPAAVSACLSA